MDALDAVRALILDVEDGCIRDFIIDRLHAIATTLSAREDSFSFVGADWPAEDLSAPPPVGALLKAIGTYADLDGITFNDRPIIEELAVAIAWCDDIGPLPAAREDGRCLHGVRLPHECKDCQDAVTEGETQQSLRADCYDMIAEILEDNDMAGSSIVDSVQVLVDRVKAAPKAPTAGEGK